MTYSAGLNSCCSRLPVSPPIRRIAICTGGGDAPGLNAVIRATASAAANRGWECVGIRDGFNGLLEPGRYPQGGLVPLTRERVRGISHLGGTILGTTNKGDPFHYPTPRTDGTMGERDRSDELLACFAREGIDALVSVGGDGSLSIAHAGVFDFHLRQIDERTLVLRLPLEGEAGRSVPRTQEDHPRQGH